MLVFKGDVSIVVVDANLDASASVCVFLLQDLLQVGDSYVVGLDGVLTDDELKEVLKVSG